LKLLIPETFLEEGCFDYSQWADLDTSFSVEEACRKLNEDESGLLDVSSALLKLDPPLRSVSDLEPEVRKYLRTNIARGLLKYYPEEGREKWEEQLKKFEQNTQNQRQ